MKPEELKEGLRVEYHPVGLAETTSTGKITQVLTEKQPAGETGVNVQASEEEPRFVILNENTNKETAYKAENIVKILD